MAQQPTPPGSNPLLPQGAPTGVTPQNVVPPSTSKAFLESKLGGPPQLPPQQGLPPGQPSPVGQALAPEGPTLGENLIKQGASQSDILKLALAFGVAALSGKNPEEMVGRGLMAVGETYKVSRARRAQEAQGEEQTRQFEARQKLSKSQQVEQIEATTTSTAARMRESIEDRKARLEQARLDRASRESIAGKRLTAAQKIAETKAKGEGPTVFELAKMEDMDRKAAIKLMEFSFFTGKFQDMPYDTRYQEALKLVKSARTTGKPVPFGEGGQPIFIHSDGTAWKMGTEGVPVQVTEEKQLEEPTTPPPVSQETGLVLPTEEPIPLPEDIKGVILPSGKALSEAELQGENVNLFLNGQIEIDGVMYKLLPGGAKGVYKLEPYTPPAEIEPLTETEAIQTSTL